MKRNRRLTKLFSVFYLFLLICSSCTTPGKSFLASRTPHEKYEKSLADANLTGTALGQKWLGAAQKALEQPLSITLPYRETGYFAAENPAAAGYRFAARRGENIEIAVSTDSLHPLLLFVDWYKWDTVKPKFIKAADTSAPMFRFEVEEDGDYQLRLQPELLKSGQYTLTLSVRGSLAFPVPSQNHPHIGSFWGAARDAGARRHEGIDIFGSFRTPVVAAADGIITSTRGNNLGGNVVFLRPDSKNFTLYYAHLDSQTVTEGQRVAAGDVVGLMGNTGNARTTPTHLHFGIYTNGGAIDPLPFVDRSNERPKNIAASLKPLGEYRWVNTTTSLYNEISAQKAAIEKVSRGTPVQVNAAVSDWYKVQLPDGKEGFVKDNTISAQSVPLINITAKQNAILFDSAFSSSSPKYKIAAGTELPVLGSFGNFYLVKVNNVSGWIEK